MYYCDCCNYCFLGVNSPTCLRDLLDFEHADVMSWSPVVMWVYVSFAKELYFAFNVCPDSPCASQYNSTSLSRNYRNSSSSASSYGPCWSISRSLAYCPVSLPTCLYLRY